MLKGSFFDIATLDKANETITAVLKINVQSDIFRGHFPDRPIVPGACLLQILKEVLETALKLPIQLHKADHLKFITIINPLETSTLDLKISYKISGDLLQVNAHIGGPGITYAKFQGTFKIALRSLVQ